jgi:autotransporter-associated beta strand protein
MTISVRSTARRPLAELLASPIPAAAGVAAGPGTDRTAASGVRLFRVVKAGLAASPRRGARFALRRALLASTALVASTALTALVPRTAHAQAVWQGTTMDYNAAGNWSTNSVPAGPGDEASFQNTGTTTVFVSSAVAPYSLTFTSNAQSYYLLGATVTIFGSVFNNSAVSQRINAVLAGAGSVQQNGSGTLTLEAANSYTGGTRINAGTLALTGRGTLGDAANSVTIRSGTLAVGSTSQTVGVISNSGTIDVGFFFGSLTATGGITNNARGMIANAGVVRADIMALADSTVNNGGLWFGNVNVGGGTIVNNSEWSGNATNSGGTLTNNNLWFGAVANDHGTFNNKGAGHVTGG